MQVDPADIRSLKAEVICVKYRKPERVGSLWLAPRHLEDETGMIWEVWKSNEKADLILGEEVASGDIVKTRWGAGVELGVETKDGRGLYLIKAEDIYHRTKNTWSG